MTENRPFLEPNSPLDIATHALTNVCMFEHFDRMTGEFNQDNSNIRWTNATQRHPAFADKIAGLQGALASAAQAIKDVPPFMRRVYEHPFRKLEDGMAQALLGDLVVSRISVRGQMNGELNPAQETEDMAGELGLTQGWEETKTVTVPQIVEAILEGKLRVAPSTE